MIIDCHSHHISPPYNTNYLAWVEKTGRRDYGPPYLWNNPIFQDISKRIEKPPYRLFYHHLQLQCGANNRQCRRQWHLTTSSYG